MPQETHLAHCDMVPLTAAAAADPLYIKGSLPPVSHHRPSRCSFRITVYCLTDETHTGLHGRFHSLSESVGLHGYAKQGAHASGKGHRQRTQYGHPYPSHTDRRATRPRGQGTQRSQ